MFRFTLTFCAVVLVGMAGPLAVLAQAPSPTAGQPVLIIAPAAANLVLAAGGELASPVSAPFAVLAQGEAEFLKQIAASRAWMIMDGGWLAEICG